MEVVFSNRAYTAVLSETAEKIKTETGGLFLGIVKDNIYYIIEAIDPGPKSIFEVAYFEYDQKYTQHLINKIANLYETKLELIGLWHRHPGSFDVFSSTDNGTNAKYASMRSCGAISALVNIDHNFRLTMYHVSQPCRYSKIKYSVGDELIPNEFLKLKPVDTYLKYMNKSFKKQGDEEDSFSVSVSFESFLNLVLPGFENSIVEWDNENLFKALDIETEKLLDELFDDLTYISDELHISVGLAKNEKFFILYQDTAEKTVKLFFANIENIGIIFSYNDVCYKYCKRSFIDAYNCAIKELENKTEDGNSDSSTTKENKGFKFSKIIKFKKGDQP